MKETAAIQGSSRATSIVLVRPSRTETWESRGKETWTRILCMGCRNGWSCRKNNKHCHCHCCYNGLGWHIYCRQHLPSPLQTSRCYLQMRERIQDDGIGANRGQCTVTVIFWTHHGTSTAPPPDLTVIALSAPFQCVFSEYAVHSSSRTENRFFRSGSLQESPKFPLHGNKRPFSPAECAF